MPIVHIYIKDKSQMLEGFFCNVQGFITDVEFVIQKGKVRWKEKFPLSPFVLCFVLFLQLKCYIVNPTQLNFSDGSLNTNLSVYSRLPFPLSEKYPIAWGWLFHSSVMQSLKMAYPWYQQRTTYEKILNTEMVKHKLIHVVWMNVGKTFSHPLFISAQTSATGNCLTNGH